MIKARTNRSQSKPVAVPVAAAVEMTTEEYRQ
jgi:hypothetical protein